MGLEGTQRSSSGVCRAGSLFKSQPSTHQRFCCPEGNPRVEGEGWRERIFILHPFLEDSLLAKALGKQILPLCWSYSIVPPEYSTLRVLPDLPAPVLVAAPLGTGETGPGLWVLLPHQGLGKEPLSTKHPPQQFPDVPGPLPRQELLSKDSPRCLQYALEVSVNLSILIHLLFLWRM